jgi:hypothetical protein
MKSKALCYLELLADHMDFDIIGDFLLGPPEGE